VLTAGAAEAHKLVLTPFKSDCTFTLARLAHAALNSVFAHLASSVHRDLLGLRFRENQLQTQWFCLFTAPLVISVRIARRAVISAVLIATCSRQVIPLIVLIGLLYVLKLISFLVSNVGQFCARQEFRCRSQNNQEFEEHSSVFFTTMPAEIILESAPSRKLSQSSRRSYAACGHVPRVHKLYYEKEIEDLSKGKIFY